jgi:hypothetical protein
METFNKNKEQIVDETAIKQPSKIWLFIKKHKFYVILLALLLMGALYHIIRIKTLENTLTKEKIAIENHYKIKIDSLNSHYLLLTAKTFSWAIRSELLRENSEQVNQFFNDFVKNTSIRKLQYIDAATQEIQISTDKKDEGVKDVTYTATVSQEIYKDTTHIKIVTPINGLNSKLGTFVMIVNQ